MVNSRLVKRIVLESKACSNPFSKKSIQDEAFFFFKGMYYIRLKGNFAFLFLFWTQVKS